MHAYTYIKQELGEVDALMGPTKSMPLRKTHMEQSHYEEFSGKNVSKPQEQGRHTSLKMVTWLPNVSSVKMAELGHLT